MLWCSLLNAALTGVHVYIYLTTGSPFALALGVFWGLTSLIFGMLEAASR